ncbi:MAG: MBL fold metallo-hydrolase [Fibrobacteres bacterium]|nr:MBL fold metallo-hydrolase [Fibrobacterota bacterium]
MKTENLKCLAFPSGPLETNTYLVHSEAGDAAIVDPVELNSALFTKINELKLIVRALLITHTHVDHIYSISEYASKFNVPVYMHSAAEKMRDFYTESCEMLGFGSNTMPKEYFACDRLETIQFGQSKLSVITSPGHSPCGIMYMADDFIITGDTLFKGSIGRYDLHLASLPLLYQSLKKLAPFQDDVKIYPGHGPSTTLGYERKTNHFLQACKG